MSKWTFRLESRILFVAACLGVSFHASAAWDHLATHDTLLPEGSEVLSSTSGGSNFIRQSLRLRNRLNQPPSLEESFFVRDRSRIQAEEWSAGTPEVVLMPQKSNLGWNLGYTVDQPFLASSVKQSWLQQSLDFGLSWAATERVSFSIQAQGSTIPTVGLQHGRVAVLMEWNGFLPFDVIRKKRAHALPSEERELDARRFYSKVHELKWAEEDAEDEIESSSAAPVRTSSLQNRLRLQFDRNQKTTSGIESSLFQNTLGWELGKRWGERGWTTLGASWTNYSASPDDFVFGVNLPSVHRLLTPGVSRVTSSDGSWVFPSWVFDQAFEYQSSAQVKIWLGLNEVIYARLRQSTGFGASAGVDYQKSAAWAWGLEASTLNGAGTSGVWGGMGLRYSF